MVTGRHLAIPQYKFILMLFEVHMLNFELTVGKKNMFSGLKSKAVLRFMDDSLLSSGSFPSL
jgi:hypothetical protein